LDLAAKKAFHRSVRQKKPYAVNEVKSLNESKVKEFFRPDMTVVGENDMVEEAAKRMIKKKVSSVVVVAKHKPAGVLSAVDLFRHIQNVARGEESADLVISGLGDDNIMMYPHIKDKIGSVLDKFSGSFNIRNAKVHVKEKKSVFNMNLYFDTDKGYISLSGERSTLKETVDELAVELNTILAKRKDKRKAKTRKVHKTKRARVRKK
ncbi:TPA: CBS domain-containing protein, partial [Candidatus Micrarchaeota archaeon]|nr:CBS domain-containing protein [Candidatus Micrarchaeota archaeon]